jgi:hypothetical protein
MIVHCFYCRFDGHQDWDTPNNRCKGLDRDSADESDSVPCRYVGSDGATHYRCFMPVGEANVEDVLDRLLPAFDTMKNRLEKIEHELRLITQEKKGVL